MRIRADAGLRNDESNVPRETVVSPSVPSRFCAGSNASAGLIRRARNSSRLDVLSASGDDKLIPHVVWQNLHPLLETDSQRLLTLLDSDDLRKSPAIAPLMPRIVDRVVATRDPGSIVALVNLLIGEAKSDPSTL